jgi:PAS domain S-box-containing protein
MPVNVYCTGMPRAAPVDWRLDMASPVRQMGAKRHHDAAWPDMFANLQTAYAELTRAQFELERRLAENEAERDLFLQVMTSMSEAVFLMDRTGRVIRINHAVSNLFEGNEAELVGRPFAEVCGSDEIPATPWQLVERAPSGRLSHVDVEISTQLGHIIPVSISMALVRDRRGKITGMQAVMRDITERNRAEEALHKAHDELEMRVSKRTAELARANADLRDEIARRLEAETCMKAALQQQDTLLKEIHHRVKNNLQIISSLLSLQSRYITDPRALQVFNNSQNRVKSMALIHEILYLENNLLRIDFARYVRGLMSYLFHSHGVSSKDITFKIISRDIQFGVDTAVSCGLIINELISNSLRHAFPEKRKGKVYIKLRMNKNKVNLVVGDDGIGLPKNFDIRNRQSLGLKLVIGLVNQLGGTINFDSNSGARFSITFTAEDF